MPICNNPEPLAETDYHCARPAGHSPPHAMGGYLWDDDGVRIDRLPAIRRLAGALDAVESAEKWLANMHVGPGAHRAGVGPVHSALRDARRVVEEALGAELVAEVKEQRLAGDGE